MFNLKYPEELLAERVKELEAEVAALNEALGEDGELLTIAWMDGMHRSNKAHRERVKELEAENDTLKSLVRGWHYLAVGPDEMGDYYTHKQLIKASEPYASPALVALAGKAEQ